MCTVDFYTTCLSSDYPADKEETRKYLDTGILSYVNCVDIPSQALKIGFSVLGTVAYLVYKVVVAVLALIALPFVAITWGISALCGFGCARALKAKTISLAQTVGYNLGFTVFTVVISLPTSLVIKTTLIACETIGIFVPCVGKWARIKVKNFEEKISLVGTDRVAPQALVISSYCMKQIIDKLSSRPSRVIRNNILENA